MEKFLSANNPMYVEFKASNQDEEDDEEEEEEDGDDGEDDDQVPFVVFVLGFFKKHVKFPPLIEVFLELLLYQKYYLNILYQKF